MTTATIEKAFSPPQVSDLHSTKDERHAHALNIQARIRENKQYRDLVGKEWKQFQLKAIHVSTTVPKRPHAGKGRTSSKKRTGQPVPTCHEESSESEAGPSRPSKPGKNVDDADFRPSTVSRNENEKKRCRKREGSKCLYTGMAQGEVTHILPFTWKNIDHAVKATGSVLLPLHPFFSDDIVQEIWDLAADDSDLGSSDKWWNMLYMNAQLHTFWI
ncbi:uncharacterized protein B0J16DRAFT_387090 [Fusarium flagelliforme]|uniref:uncharacterized protein n=1 Tax=Fusarium flagelliforme TaxID=2675880 RepID=UPI001E8DD01F|nr:uncharacterized protein B0J16DRAFT_387090 [Fusarium flagelliforme]KAH7179256.1 hypothetical protein B0J16DRAFT_387090 [Fusarium flagelliforme]